MKRPSHVEQRLLFLKEWDATIDLVFENLPDHEKAVLRPIENESLAMARKELRVISEEAKKPEKFEGFDFWERIDTIQKAKSQKAHSPRETASFLSLFSTDDQAKFVTHDWDETKPFNLSVFHETVYGVIYNALKERFPNVPNWTLAKVNSFLFKRKFKVNDPAAWGYQKLDIGWSSPEVTNWCKENPGISPDQFYFRKPIQKTLNHQLFEYWSFRDIMAKFKKEIRFINEENHFVQYLIDQCEQFGLYQNHRPQYDESLNGLDFYVDVDKFGAGLKRIFKGLAAVKSCPNIIFSAKRDLEKIEFSIFQQNGKILRNSPKEQKIHPDLLSGDFKEAQRYLKSQCDWTFEGPFNNGEAWAMHYLSHKDVPKIERSTCVDGVKHTCTFYYP